MARKLEWSKKKGYGNLIYHISSVVDGLNYKITQNTERGVLILLLRGRRIEKNYGYEKSVKAAKAQMPIGF